MREELMLQLIKDKLTVKKAEEALEKKQEQERFNHYIESRVKGKTRSVIETLLSVRQDMAAYGEQKGGVIGGFFKHFAAFLEKKHEEQMKAEAEENGEEEQAAPSEEGDTKETSEDDEHNKEDL